MIRDHGGFKFENEPTIVVAGNIRIAAGSMNCRIVLRKVKAGNSPSGFEYITHQENVLGGLLRSGWHCLCQHGRDILHG